jgi:hypothetical protein
VFQPIDQSTKKTCTVFLAHQVARTAVGRIKNNFIVALWYSTGRLESVQLNFFHDIMGFINRIIMLFIALAFRNSQKSCNFVLDY